MDLQLADINGDCVVLDLHVEAVDQQLTIDDPLPRDTVARFLRELDAYHAEGRSSATVARFMRSLPAGLTSQEYVGTHGTQSIGQVVLGAPVVTAVQGARWPKSERLSGAITSVGFDPDRPFVQVGTTKCSATPEQVERALSLRHGPVVAFVVRREQDLRPRLVSLRSGSLPWAPPSSDDRVATLLADWSETLRILGS